MYYSNADVRVEEQEVPGVGPGDVLIRVRASGICGSDLMEWYRIKRAPLVLGHEVTGEVVEVGAGRDGWRPGDRVFATHHVPCGECLYCLRGNETACRTLQEVNNFAPGGFAEYLRVTGQQRAHRHPQAAGGRVVRGRARSSSRWRRPCAACAPRASPRATACWCTAPASPASSS